MRKGPLVIFGIFAAVCVVVIPYMALAGDGGKEAAPVKVESQDEDGKALFVSNCGPCHTLAAAGTDGVVGPDLDDRLVPTGTGNFEGNTARTLTAVICGFGEGRMPAGILQGENAQEVAMFVGAYAGQLSEEAGPLADTSEEEPPEIPECPTGGSETGASASSQDGS